MNIIQYILIYLMIGTIFTFFVDLMNDFLKTHEQLDYQGPSAEDWGIIEHIMCVVFWPIAIFIFVRGFFQKPNE